MEQQTEAIIVSKHSEQMTFLNRHFDPKQTRENVKRFFEVDYPAAKRRAGQFRTNRTGISSPQITGMPSGSSASNGVAAVAGAVQFSPCFIWTVVMIPTVLNICRSVRVATFISTSQPPILSLRRLTQLKNY